MSVNGVVVIDWRHTLTAYNGAFLVVLDSHIHSHQIGNQLQMREENRDKYLLPHKMNGKQSYRG